MASSRALRMYGPALTTGNEGQELRPESTIGVSPGVTMP
jgi:hypothetical protein